MPYILDTRSSRRTFLSRTGAACLGLTALHARPAAAQAAPAGAVRLALLSDTHIPANPEERFRGFSPVDNLRELASQVARATVDAAVITGDLARLIGTADDYAALVTLLRPISDRLPVSLLLGNHDDRANFLRAFPPPTGAATAVPNKHVLAFDRGPLRFILLDSLLAPNVTPGQLGTAQRTWLRDTLAAAPERPTAVFVHHTLDGTDGALVDSDRLFEVLRPFTQVKAVLFGHSHRYHVDSRDGVQLINLPAIGYNFADTEPVGWVESSWTPTGVDLTLRAIGGQQSGDGQTRAIRWLR